VVVRSSKSFLKGLALVFGLPFAIFFVWFGSGFVYETWNSTAYRYRLTVEIEDNGTVYSGSSVWHVTVTNKADWIPQSGGGIMMAFGQAVVIDMGAKGSVFVLLKENKDDYLTKPEYLVPTHIPVFDEGTMMLKKAIHYDWNRLSAEIPANRLPLMVRFRDINNPMTVERVDPQNMSNVGQGVRFKRATIETVSRGRWPFNVVGIWGKPMTTGIEEKLPWLDEYYEKLFDGRTIHTIEAENQLANSLGAGSFKTWR
jgi:hypothetical protein